MYPDERSALETVKKLVEQFGSGYADDLSLGRIAADGRVLAPLTGRAQLAKLESSDTAVGRKGCVVASTDQRRKVR